MAPASCSHLGMSRGQHANRFAYIALEGKRQCIVEIVYDILGMLLQPIPRCDAFEIHHMVSVHFFIDHLVDLSADYPPHPPPFIRRLAEIWVCDLGPARFCATCTCTT